MEIQKKVLMYLILRKQRMNQVIWILKNQVMNQKMIDMTQQMTHSNMDPAVEMGFRDTHLVIIGVKKKDMVRKDTKVTILPI